jgi:enamine deaminase RidA (YjgF/YER057c/UK114 family)
MNTTPDARIGHIIAEELPMRRLVSSKSPLEPLIGFSRAVRVGQIVAVSGTAPIAADGSVACPGDVYGQTRRCLGIIRMLWWRLAFPSTLWCERESC